MKFARILFSTAAAFLTVTAFNSPVSAADHRGVVLEAITGGGYTYLNIEEDGKKFWIAGPETKIEKGAEVSFNEQVWMPNFKSRALGRTFDKILFVSGVSGGTPDDAPVDGEGDYGAGTENIDEIHSGGVYSPDEAASEGVEDEEADLADEEDAEDALPADGMYTVQDIYSMANRLKGETVKVRGEVVKVSENIMGRNWIHLQDGTGTRGKNKLVFRSGDDIAKVGDTVIAEGRLDTDKDFGFGYFYSVIVEDASFTEVVEEEATDVPEAVETPDAVEAPGTPGKQ